MRIDYAKMITRAIYNTIRCIQTRDIIVNVESIVHDCNSFHSRWDILICTCLFIEFVRCVRCDEIFQRAGVLVSLAKYDLQRDMQSRGKLYC